MVSDKDYEEFEHFFQTKSDLFSKVQRGVDQSLETIRVNSKWQKNNYQKIGKLLTEY